ncbi:alpha/beta hydrolase family protein [Tellurirhabdus bombi]|uniref:alpha/beta hydrolase family protein n=1 Tax=Tellurirhabdus bombi TaxID=2907205 RepID=UPI001F3C3C8D|nr:alpha/beta hydrolase [Tellurirhabdus bombi]
MKYLSLLGLILLTGFVQAQTGKEKRIYQGQLGPIRLVLHLYTDSLTRQPAAHFESPDQGVKKIPIHRLSETADSLIAESKTINGVFKGKFEGNKQTAVGIWKQQGMEAPLTLKRVGAISEPARPQTPKPPFPYRSDNVTFANKDKSLQFGGTLTIPTGNGPFPTVVLLSGSGAQDRDETLLGHKPFWVIADHLSRAGFAVLRVDDRGVGQTTGNFDQSTAADFAQDALAAIDYLKTRPEVAKKKIGLIGHSEGGITAPLAATQSKDVAYLVSLAGVGVKGIDLLKRQYADIVRASGMLNEEFIGYFTSMQTAMLQAVANQPMSKTDLTADVRLAMANWQQSQPQERLQQMGVAGTAGQKMADEFAKAASAKWYHYIVKYDPAPVLSKLTIPVLALNGDKDMQVSAVENLAAIEKGLTQAGNKNFKTQTFPGLNHLFQTSTTGSIQEYGLLEETFSPQALEAMTTWLKEITK